MSIITSITQRLRGNPASPSDDTTLVERARDGNLDAFNELVDRYQLQLYRVCYRLVRNQPTAEDITQESFVRAWEVLDQYHGGSFKAWLLRIGTNRSLDHLRAQKRRPANSLDDEPVESEHHWTTQTRNEDPDEFAARQHLSAALDQALEQLSDDQRLTVILYDVQGYSYEEIADITEASSGTVKSRLNRGRAKLRAIINESETSRELFGTIQRQHDREDHGPRS